MGIIIRQSIKGSIWSYLGVGVGFITTAYLFPNYLTTETIGLFSLLMAWSTLSAQIASLGFNGVTARLFPYFRNKEQGHKGFLFIAFMVAAIGFALFLAAYFIFSPWLAENNAEKSGLFSDYIFLIVPITLFSLFFTLLDSYNRLLFNAVFGIFLTEFLQRVLILLMMLLFVSGLLNVHQLILAYAGAVSMKGIIIFFHLLAKKEINLKPQLHFVNGALGKEMFSVALFSILASVGSNIVFKIDKIIVNEMLGLGATGVYTIAFFFGTLVSLPSRPLLKISSTLIAEAWKKDDRSYIADIYKRSCLNQFIIGAFLFGGIWLNIDSILTILGPEYAAGKWVIFFIGLGFLIDMATGANSRIIALSRYYRVALLFLLILVAVVISSMYLLIPVLGITGAAIAIALSFLANNFMRFIFLYRKFGFQPFTYHNLLVFAAFFPAYFSGLLLPELPLVWDILARGTVFAVVYMGIIIGLNISSDVNTTLTYIFKYFSKKWM